MSDAKRSNAESVDVPADMDDKAAMRQFYTDVLDILADMQNRLDSLEQMLSP